MLVGGRLYFLATDRTMVCLDRDNGDEIWAKRIPGETTDDPFHGSLVTVDGVACVYLEQLFALDLETGNIAWEYGETTGATANSSPVVWSHDNTNDVIVIDAKGNAHCIAATTGEPKWQLKCQAGAATPLIVDELLITYCKSRRGGVAAFRLNGDEPTELWRNQEFADAGSSPVAIGGYLFVQGERKLACLDLSSGETEWSHALDMPRPRYTSIVGSEDFLLYAFDGLLAFSAESEGWRLWFDAKIDRESRIATAESIRNRLSLAELESTTDGVAQAKRIWRREVEQAGPLPCCTPVLDQGMLFIRLRDRLAVYDLRESTDQDSEPEDTEPNKD